MKRSFSASDRVLPYSLHEVRGALENLVNVEDTIIDKFNSYHRCAFAKPSTTDPSITQKIYRVYVRHVFISETSEEKAHFLIRFEGCVLDPKYESNLGSSFCEIFEKVKIQPDKRFYVQQALEWDCHANFSSSCRGTTGNFSSIQMNEAITQCPPQAVEFKLYGDKQSMAKISLHQSSKVCMRYEVSSLLREKLLPCIRLDPTIEEVVVAIVHYAQRHYLVKARKNMIHFDSNLKDIFGDIDQIPTSQIGDKLIEYQLLKPFRKSYQVDLPLNHQASFVFPEGESIYNTASMSRMGGKIFDIEIDLVDEYAYETQSHLNSAAVLYENVEKSLSNLFVKTQFLSSKIDKTQKELDILLQLGENPLKVLLQRNLDLFNYVDSFKKTDGQNSMLSPNVINARLRNVEKTVRRRGHCGSSHFENEDIYLNCYDDNRNELRDKREYKYIEDNEEQDDNHGNKKTEPENFYSTISDVGVVSPFKPNTTEASERKRLKLTFASQGSESTLRSLNVISPPDYHGYIHAYEGFLDVGSDNMFQLLSLKHHS